MRRQIHPITIDTGVPMPSGNLRYPFAQMKVGDSFVLPLAKRASVSNIISRMHSNPDIKEEYSVRKQDSETIRVWRIK